MSQRNSRAIQEIKSRLSIVDVARRYMELQRNGHRFVAPCPFHQETKPSFSINEEEGFFYCFGCQAAGDLFDFYGRINGLDFRETLEQLAEEAGVVLEQTPSGRQEPRPAQSERKQLLRLHELAAAHFAANLETEAGAECRDYMARRGISAEVSRQFGLGFAQQDWQALATVFKRAGFDEAMGIKAALLARSDKGRAYDRFRGRFMFPIRSLSGNVVAFGGRIIANEDEAKYINSSDSPLYKKGEHLYGLDQARKAIATGKPALLTEGYMDVVTLHQFGYASAVGVLGTALTPEQVKRIAGFTSRLELLFDGDNAGRKAALRACRMFLTKGLSCRVVLFPEGEDIDSLLRSAGIEAFEALRTSAPDGMQFCIQALRDMAPRDAVDFARGFIKDVELPELAGRYVTLLAGGLGIAEQELRDFAVSQRARDDAGGSSSAQRQKSPPPRRNDARDREIMTFAVRYPHALPRLKEAGAHLYLRNAWAEALWNKIEDEPSEGLFHTLTDVEKRFWIKCRSSDVPPLDNEEGEFTAIVNMVNQLHKNAHSASVTAALHQGGDFATELEYLRALQETLERTHGEH